MGVQKSRKSIRFTKYSRLLVTPKNFMRLNIFKKKSFVRFILEKNDFKQTRLYFLKQRENDKPFFYN